MRSSSDTCYFIQDGDIPCTPETEPSYSYVWNFCDVIGSSSVPEACKKLDKTNAVALQYLDLGTSSDCYVIGKYDSNNDDAHYALLDDQNPALGVSIKYALGDKCSTGVLRSATIDIVCANVESSIVSALEPNHCEYHMVMKSYYGCPTDCPVTKNGLCNSHGHCAFDTVNKKSYCYCNAGYGGSSCKKQEGSGDYDGYGVQMGLLVTLLIVTVGLVVVIGGLIHRITQLRKQQVDNYNTLSRSSEMVEHTF